MLRASLQQLPPPGQLLFQRRPTGVAQRSGAKASAKRFDLSSTHNAPAGNQADPTAFTLKAFSPPAPTQPLSCPNIHIVSAFDNFKQATQAPFHPGDQLSSVATIGP